jgi:Zn-dependent M16 (insulinase) family peptidase
MKMISPDLLNRIKVFVYDLLNLTDNKIAQKRLENNISQYYLSTDYFTESERSFILSFSYTGSTLKQLLL